MSWWEKSLRSMKAQEIPDLIEKFENTQQAAKNNFYGVGPNKDSAGIMDPIYKIFYNLINGNINFSQIYLGYKLSKNIQNNYFTIEEKTISTARKDGAKKTNYRRILNNFFNKSYDKDDKDNISVYKLWDDYVNKNYSQTKPRSTTTCDQNSKEYGKGMGEKTYCINKKINDYGKYVINKIKSDFEKKYKDEFSSSSGGKRKTKHNKVRKKRKTLKKNNKKKK